MRVLQGIILLIVAQSSLGKAKHVRLGGIMDHDINDPKIFNSLADKLRYTVPKELTNENGMILVKLNQAQSQVVQGIRWIYKFEAKGMSSDIPYSCKLVILKQLWKRQTDVVNYFHCNKSEKN